MSGEGAESTLITGDLVKAVTNERADWVRDFWQRWDAIDYGTDD